MNVESIFGQDRALRRINAPAKEPEHHKGQFLTWDSYPFGNIAGNIGERLTFHNPIYFTMTKMDSLTENLQNLFIHKQKQEKNST